MKKLILTIAIMISIVLGIRKSTYAAISDKQASTRLTAVTPISKIEIHGNVELYLSNDTTDKVTVYNNYYSENALVQNQQGVLRVTNYKTEKLVVWVAARDLASITAYDNAEVKSFGTFSAVDLDIKLYNNAYAQLNMDVYRANISLNDHAKANFAGNISEGSLTYSQSASVNTFDLAASITVKKQFFEHRGAHGLLASL